MEDTLVTKYRTIYRTILLSALVTGIGIRVQAAAEPPAYHVTDLGTLGGTYSAGLGINASGQVTGNSYTAGNAATHAFLWTPTTPNGVSGSLLDLGTLGGTSSEGWGINASGRVTGYSQTTGDAAQHAFLYDGTLHDLGTLDGTASVGWDINDSGQVVGYSDGGGAFLYLAGVMRDLTTADGLSSHAVGINAIGQVAGVFYSADAAENHAFLWTPTTPNGLTGSFQDLGTLGGTFNSYAYDINDSGQVTGYSITSQGEAYHAFLYDEGVMQDIGWLDSWLDSTFGLGINNSGQIVGASGGRAFLYSGGAMVDLNSLIDPLSGWALGNAWAINDAGQITGWGYIGGRQNAFLLTPVPEPSSIALLILSVPLLVLHNSRRSGRGGMRGGRRFILTVTTRSLWRTRTDEWLTLPRITRKNERRTP
jgi:probable HAF family extracellular repeat protein